MLVKQGEDHDRERNPTREAVYTDGISAPAAKVVL